MGKLEKIKLSQTKLCIVLCSLFIIIFIFLWTPIINSSLISSEGFHFSMELSSSILAVIIGIFGIAYFINGGNTFSLIVGLGFFIAGSEDLVHGYISIKTSHAAPETYIIGRVILGILIILGVISEKKIKKRIQIKIISLIIVPVTLITGMVVIFNIHLPPIEKPHIIPGILNYNDFFLAIIFFIATITCIIRLHRKNDIITSFLSISTLLMAFAQVYLSYSREMNDMPFIAAHTSVFLSYAIMISGLLAFIFNQYNILSATKHKLKENERVLEQERSQLLSIFNNIDDLIYVVDPDNSRVLFANKSMEQAFGKKLKGKICYKEICDLKYRCSHCILNNSNSSKHSADEYNKVLDKTFTTTESYIKWPDGKDVVFHILSDISKMAESKEELEQTLSETIRLNELMIRREKRIIEMKREVNSLLLELNREIKYKNTEI